MFFETKAKPFGLNLNPCITVGAMRLSSVSVVPNTLSLKTFKTKILPTAQQKIDQTVSMAELPEDKTLVKKEGKK